MTARGLVVVLLGVLAAAACGKKGAPLPPLQRIPTQIQDLAVTRLDDMVYARFTVPSANIDGLGPADLARVELYALTTAAPPAELQLQDAEDLRAIATLVATEPVRKPLPPPPPRKEGAPPPPPMPELPPAPGVDQGMPVVMTERLTPEMQTLVELPDPIERPEVVRETALSLPLVASAEVVGPLRYYFAVGVSPRGRYGPLSGFVPAPLALTSSAPAVPEVVVEETKLTVRWTPAPDERGRIEAAPEGLLPSRSLVPSPPATTYEVYEVTADGSPVAPPLPPAAGAAPAPPVPSSMPVPLTPAPIGALEFEQLDITLGSERCFVVRPVDIINGLHVRGPASPIACASLADTFAPQPPTALAAVARPGDIGLIWEPSPSTDVAGYLVLRGPAGAKTLEAITAEPITGTTYTDATTQPGVRYSYAVVAVDRAGNRSEESNRAEETARQ